MSEQRDYIEREALGTILNKAIHNSCGGAKVAGIRYARDMLATIPPADVRPVVRGEWVKVDDNLYRCSHCQSEIEMRDIYIADCRYCPVCGAEMWREVGNYDI